MLRKILAFVAGLVTWTAVVFGLGMAVRYSWADYAAVEKAMTFTPAMMIVRLSLSGIGSIASGYVAAAIAKERFWSPLIAGLALLLLFIPVHYSLWDKFPLWYHLTFLTSLPVLSVLAGRLRRG